MEYYLQNHSLEWHSHSFILLFYTFFLHFSYRFIFHFFHESMFAVFYRNHRFILLEIGLTKTDHILFIHKQIYNIYIKVKQQLFSITKQGAFILTVKWKMKFVCMYSYVCWSRTILNGCTIFCFSFNAVATLFEWMILIQLYSTDYYMYSYGWE